MLEGIVISVVVAYGAAWLFLKAFYKWDASQCRKIRERMHRKMLIRHGRIISDAELLENGRTDTLHGWD